MLGTRRRCLRLLAREAVASTNDEDDVHGHVLAVVCSRGGVAARLVVLFVHTGLKSGVAQGTGVRATWLSTL